MRCLSLFCGNNNSEERFISDILNNLFALMTIKDSFCTAENFSRRGRSDLHNSKLL